MWDQYKCLLPLIVSVWPDGPGTHLIDGLLALAKRFGEFPTGAPHMLWWLLWWLLLLLLWLLRLRWLLYLLPLPLPLPLLLLLLLRFLLLLPLLPACR